MLLPGSNYCPLLFFYGSRYHGRIWRSNVAHSCSYRCLCSTEPLGSPQQGPTVKLTAAVPVQLLKSFNFNAESWILISTSGEGNIAIPKLHSTMILAQTRMEAVAAASQNEAIEVHIVHSKEVINVTLSPAPSLRRPIEEEPAKLLGQLPFTMGFSLHLKPPTSSHLCQVT